MEIFTDWMDWLRRLNNLRDSRFYLSAFQLFWKIILNVAAHWFAKWPIMTSKAQSLFSKRIKKKKINLYRTWDKINLFFKLKGTVHPKLKRFLLPAVFGDSFGKTLGGGGGSRNVGNVRCHGVKMQGKSKQNHTHKKKNIPQTFFWCTQIHMLTWLLLQCAALCQRNHCFSTVQWPCCALLFCVMCFIIVTLNILSF